MLPYYQDLLLVHSGSEFESRVNANLNNLMAAATGCGIQAIQAQYRLKQLKSMNQDERLKLYEQALTNAPY